MLVYKYSFSFIDLLKWTWTWKGTCYLYYCLIFIPVKFFCFFLYFFTSLNAPRLFITDIEFCLKSLFSNLQIFYKLNFTNGDLNMTIMKEKTFFEKTMPHVISKFDTKAIFDMIK